MIAALLLAMALQADPGVPEAKTAFEGRQQDLVELAGRLGELHRLSQLCGDYGNLAIFRDRMKAVVEGEKPPRNTREAMIDAFNDRYRQMAERHYTCSISAESDYRGTALEALSITERLSRGMLEG